MHPSRSTWRLMGVVLLTFALVFTDLLWFGSGGTSGSQRALPVRRADAAASASAAAAERAAAAAAALLPSPAPVCVQAPAPAPPCPSPPPASAAAAAARAAARSHAAAAGGDACAPPAAPFIVVLAQPTPAPFNASAAGAGAACVEVHDYYPGHRAVTPSAVAALRAVEAAGGARVWFNPTCAWEHADAVVVLNPGGGAVRAPTELEPLRAVASVIYAGPNALVHKWPELGGLADAWIVPSPGVGDMITAHSGPDVNFSFFTWPAGVNTTLWAPAVPQAARREHAMIYVKTNPGGVLAETKAALTAAGIKKITEVHYGAYDLPAYREALLTAGVMIVFSISESQGVFLFEAWAADVPTFVYAGGFAPVRANAIHVAFQHEYEGRLWLSEPAPYLTPLTGAYWTTPAQLGSLLRPELHYRPRQWVLKHGTLEIVGAMLADDVRARLRDKCESALG